ncbi:MAG: hopanoid-associated sugar epimerase [Geminicoccaceae bacterium]
MILVTGASGFIGSAVVRRLLGAGHDVRALVRKTSRLANLDGHRVDMAIGDLSDRPSLERALRGCSGLFHVAADYRIWVPDQRQMFVVNVDGTRNLMRAALAAGIERIVYTSSVATLGLPEVGPGNEDSPVFEKDMIGPYKRSKFLAEALVRRMIADEGLPAVIVNPSTPVGPFDIKPTPTGRLIVEAAAKRMPAYVDTGLNVVHVDDVGQGHLLAYEKGLIGRRYILGGDDMPLAEILAEIAGIYGRRPPRLQLPHAAVLPLALLAQIWSRWRGGEPFATVDGIRMAKKRMFFTSERARRELSYAPRPARDALRDAVAYFAARGLCPGLPGSAAAHRLSSAMPVGDDTGRPETAMDRRSGAARRHLGR